MSELIKLSEKITVVSTGIKDKNGKYVLEAKGKKLRCHPKVAEQFELNGWIEPVKVAAKKAEK
jgi:hypothetical protein